LLTPPVDFTNDTIGSAVDNTAATTKGGAAFLHVLTAAPSESYTFAVKGADDSGFTQNVVTLATFTLHGDVLGSEQVAISGNVPRYTRWEADRTSGSGSTVRAAVGLVRF
jgi:hypothetical protein